MSRWFSRHMRLSAFLFGLFALLLYFAVLRPMGAPYPICVLIIAVVMLSWGSLYLASIRTVSESALHALEDDCDPEPMLELSREQLALYGRGRGARRPYALACRINAATALTCLGRSGEAMDELDALSGLLSPKFGRFHALYACNRAAVCYQLGRAREMAELLDRTESLLGTLKLPKALADSYQFALRVNRAACRYLTEGPTPELEEGYCALLTEAPTQRMKVGFHMTLGRFALARGDEAEARAHLGYAVEHGNKLYYRAEAEALLDKLAPDP